MIRRPAQSALHVLHLLCALCVAAGSASASAQDMDPDRIALLNAGAIFNFVKFAEWPAGSFENEGSPIVIGFLGEDPRLLGYLDGVVRGQRSHGRPVVVRQFRFPPAEQGQDADVEAVEEFLERIKAAHLLFISARTEQDRFRTVLLGLDDADILTVSDIPRFAERGGMIGLTIRERRIAFDANPGEIRRTNVIVAARVLQLARIVETVEPLERTADAKADLVLDLLRLSRWPQESADDPRSPIVIGFLGRDALFRVLNGRVAAVTVRGRPVQLWVFQFPAQDMVAETAARDEFTALLRNAHLLFIAARTERDRFQSVLPLVDGEHVLTVSDIERFTERGGMVGLRIEANRIVVDIDSEAIDRAGISVSPRVPELSRPGAMWH